MRLHANVLVVLVMLISSFASDGNEKMLSSPESDFVTLGTENSKTSLEYIKNITPVDNGVLAEFGYDLTFDLSVDSVDIATEEKRHIGYDTEELVVYLNPYVGSEPLLMRSARKKTVVLIFSDTEQLDDMIPEPYRSRIPIIEKLIHWK